MLLKNSNCTSFYSKRFSEHIYI